MSETVIVILHVSFGFMRMIHQRVVIIEQNYNTKGWIQHSAVVFSYSAPWCASEWVTWLLLGLDLQKNLRTNL